MTIKPSFLILLILSLWSFCSLGVADKIVLKDGTIEQSDKIWESDNYYHFILKGTKDVEIRYAKAIVDHIERVPSEQSQRYVFSDPVKAGAPAEKDPAAVNQNPESSGAKGGYQSAGPVILPEEKIIKQNKGIAFYDPRRSNRYWVTQQSKHNTLKGALDAISALYRRSPQWVEAHMGEANDLGDIHQNLIAQLKKEQSEVPANDSKAPEIDAKEVTFESPRIEQGPNTPRTTNNAKPAALRPQPEPRKGIAFYDPRRPEKYWSSVRTRHNTLQEAIRALAGQYEVSEEWVSNHMGATNDLAEIHRNIQKSIIPSSPPSD